MADKITFEDKAKLTTMLGNMSTDPFTAGLTTGDFTLADGKTYRVTVSVELVDVEKEGNTKGFCTCCEGSDEKYSSTYNEHNDLYICDHCLLTIK